ncbi:MAG: diguanylate cyclase [Deltaproteobacteria bacterium]|nr:diguanylate cyclase [Deltaproteobacteria bacterium]
MKHVIFHFVVTQENEEDKARPLVLLVEHSSAQRAILRGSLLQAGYRVAEAKSAVDAESKMLESPPDAILLTWELPDAEGPDLLKKWTSNTSLETIPILMLTSHDEPDKIYQALDSGAFDFLRKPPDRLELHARIRNAVRNKALHDELRRLASRDPLTGLLNRRAFMDQLDQELARSRRYGREFALAIIDVDHFKRINDSAGHDIGDLALVQLSQHLTRSLRQVDIVARYGGEEFIVMLPETAPSRATMVLNRLRAGMQEVKWGNEQHPLSVTFSSGVSCFTAGHTPNAMVLIKHADVALYRAKNLGRNRVELAAENKLSEDAAAEEGEPGWVVPPEERPHQD